MELLGEISEESLGTKTNKPRRYKVRRAVRAILFGPGKKIPLLHSTRYRYHKIIGGGIEERESIKEALQREALEEAGYDIKIGKPVGVIIEYRNNLGTLQISYCYLANTKGKFKGVKFTNSEKSEGFRLKWVSLQEAIRLIKKDTKSKREKFYIRDRDFIVNRDLIFLEKARKISGRS